MSPRLRQVLFLVLVLAGLGLVGFGWLNRASRTPTGQSDSAPPSQAAVTVNCIGGDEKVGLLKDPDVVKTLRDQGVTVNYQPKGSIDQALMSPQELQNAKADCLWPASKAAQFLFESRSKSAFPGYRSETVLRTPEVVYSGPETTKALIKAKIVQERGKRYFIIDMAKLFDKIKAQADWRDLGSTIAGPIGIDSTDAAHSNSGFTMALLQLRILATGDPYRNPTQAQAKAVHAKLQALREAQGLQAGGSGAGFKEWLTGGGELRSPLYAGYESQVIELRQTDPALAAQAEQQVRILYPEPTVHNDHSILALTPNGARLIDAMKHPTIQQTAWNKYGFRPAQGTPDFKLFPNLALAPQVRAVNPPGAAVILDFVCFLRPDDCR